MILNLSIIKHIKGVKLWLFPCILVWLDEQALLIYFIFLDRHGAEVVADEDVAGPSERQLPAFKGAGNIFKHYWHIGGQRARNRKSPVFKSLGVGISAVL